MGLQRKQLEQIDTRKDIAKAAAIIYHEYAIGDALLSLRISREASSTKLAYLTHFY